jgi:competence protein ComFC
MGLREGLLYPIVDFLYPPTCPSCGSDAPGADLLLCPACRAALRKVSRGDTDFQVALSRLQEQGIVAGCTVVWYFEKGGPLQSLLHLAKYSSRLSLGRTMGEELGRAIARGAARPDLVIPVPLHPVKLRERGYNQSSLIAEGVMRTTGIPVASNHLRRIRYTLSQTHLTLEERMANVSGAFSVSRQILRGLNGRRVLLVDDVLTTGATLRACASVLREAGVGAVDVGTVALARSASEFSAIP